MIGFSTQLVAARVASAAAEALLAPPRTAYRRVEDGACLTSPIPEVPPVTSRRQGGLRSTHGTDHVAG